MNGIIYKSVRVRVVKPEAIGGGFEFCEGNDQFLGT